MFCLTCAFLVWIPVAIFARSVSDLQYHDRDGGWTETGETLQRGKRQSAPAFSQASYPFSIQVCSPGKPVGTVTAVGAAYYTLDTASPNVSINPYTGQIFLANIFTAPTTFQVAIRAFTTQAAFPNGVSGTTSVTVIITSCSGLGGGSTPTMAGGAATIPSGANTVSTTPPVFSQPTFTFAATSCSAGNVLGTLTLTNPTGATFAISPTTPATSFAVSRTGQVSLTPNPLFGGIGQTFKVTATNAVGTTSANVVVNVNCASSATAGTGTTTGIGTTGGASGGTSTSLPVFSQTSYTMATTSCSPASAVGSVAVINPTSVTTFALGPTPTTSFTINPINGMISLTATPLVTGTAQTFPVTATNSFGTSSATVVVNINCPTTGGSNSAVPASTAPPVFSQASYTLTASSCSVGTAVGALALANPNIGATFSLSPTTPNSYFTINSSGVVSATGSIPPGGSTQTLTVMAANTAGSATATVVVHVTCGSNADTGGLLRSANLNKVTSNSEHSSVSTTIFG